MKRILALVFASLCTHFAYPQTLVNQTLYSTFGRPNQQLEYIKAIPLGNNTVAVLDNSYSTIAGTDYESMHVAKVSLDSGVITGMDLYFLHGRDFGTSLYSRNGYLYVTGFSTDSAFSHSLQCNLAVIKVNSFDTIFTTAIQIDSAVNQMPFGIAADDSGNIYMGAAVSTPTSYKISLLKLSPTGTVVWQSDYDSSGFYNIPVAMNLTLDMISASFNVTGFSFDNGGHSHFVTIAVDPRNGHLKAQGYAENGIGMISHPVGIVSDSAGQSYVAGTSTVAGAASVIKLVKYDSLFNEIWTATWGDSSKSNTAAFMGTDEPYSSGHVFVTGSSPNSAGGTDIVTLKYDPNGTLAWERRLPAANPSYASNGIGLVADQMGDVYVTGTTFNGSDTDIVTAAYDSAGTLLWSKAYGRAAGSNDVPYSMLLDDNLYNPIVYGRSNGTDSVYMALRYDQLIKKNITDTTSSGSRFLGNQLIIRFDKSVVKQEAVNDLNTDFGKPDHWLTDSAYAALAAILPLDISQCYFERVYKGLKATYKYSLARNGDLVPIPDFWATFLLIQPDTKLNEKVVADSVNKLWPLVTATNLNYVGVFQCNPNQTGCIIDDPYFPQQWNLWDSMCVRDQQYQYHINIDSAWRLETGKSFVRVGVYDSGIYGAQEDFGAPGALAFSPYGKVRGWDFYSHSDLFSSPPWDDAAPGQAHGTHVAGIIGAIRNNGLGIAGIAGGSYTSPTDIGVSLYGMKISTPGLVDPTAYITLGVNTLLDAYVIGSSFVPDSGYGFALNVTNHSYKFIIDPAPTSATSVHTMADVSLLEEGFHYMFRNQTVSICAAGNSLHDIGYPASFQGDWVTCVGGAADNGGWACCGGPDYRAYTGPEVDVIAPSITFSGYLAKTTDYGNNLNNHVYYDNFFGTSMATPHVTGTAALLKSYLDSAASAYRNLSPEDIEHLITRSAYDIDTPGRDNNTGWGDLNAGRTLQSVNKACKKLLHLGIDTVDANHVTTQVGANVPIKLLRRYRAISRTFDTISYHFNVYRIAQPLQHNLPSNCVIEDGWARSSSTDLLYGYDASNHTLLPFEHLYMDSLTGQSVLLYGYVYELLDSLGNPTYDYLGVQDTGRASFQYTLLVKDTTKNCYPTIVTRVPEIADLVNAALYPNPSSDKTELDISLSNEKRVKVDMLSIEGQHLRLIYDGLLSSGTNRFNIDMKSLVPGIYIININFEDGKRTIKFSKID